MWNKNIYYLIWTMYDIYIYTNTKFKTSSLSNEIFKEIFIIPENAVVIDTIPDEEYWLS